MSPIQHPVTGLHAAPLDWQQNDGNVGADALKQGGQVHLQLFQLPLMYPAAEGPARRGDHSEEQQPQLAIVLSHQLFAQPCPIAIAPSCTMQPSGKIATLARAPLLQHANVLGSTGAARGPEQKIM